MSQLQTTAWLDLTAPEDTKILLDLVNKTRELVGMKTGSNAKFKTKKIKNVSRQSYPDPL